MTTAVTTIWNDFHQELKAFIFNKTKNSADTDDLLQEVFLKIMGNLDKVSQAENLRPYLYGIVRNSIHDYFRKQKQIIDATDLEATITAEETHSLNATIAECCIKPFIHKLPIKYREALLITEFQDISQKDLAEQLNLSYSGAKSRVQRGKEKLKALILDCCAYQSDNYGNLTEHEDRSCGCP